MAGEHKMADFLAKHRPTSHYWEKRSTHLVPTVDASKYVCYMSPNNLPGYVEYLPARVN